MVLEAVDALRKAGVKQGKIRKYIAEKEPTKHVTRSDVNNLLKKLKTGGVVVNGQRASQELSSGACTVSAATERATESADEGENEPGGAVESESEPVAAAESDNGSPDEVVVSSAPTGMHQASTGNTELRAEECRATVAPISAGFTIRRGSGSRRLPAAAQGGRLGLSVVAQRSRNGEAEATALSGVCDSEVASESLKLRVKRLEEQNLALYTQNAKLVEQNRQHFADLTEARKKTSGVQKELVALKKSEDELRETVGALSSEVARLKAESARWKHQAQQTNSGVALDISASQVARVRSNRRVEESDGSREPAQVPKRALDSSDFGAESVFPQSQKRASNCESS
jgi:uncharacterized small protein (DUF1192 family)